MRRTNNQGFIFVMVLLLLALAGTTLVLMARTANQVGRQNRKIILDANLYHLQVSAMAWVKKNYTTLDTQTNLTTPYSFTLNTENLDIPDAVIDGTATRIDDSHLKIELVIGCRQGRLTCTKTITYTYPIM